jgi:outer membrane protein assembly factor BamD
MRTRLIILFSVLVLLSSCGEYNQLLKSSDYELKKNKTKEYFEAGKYVKATELLAQIIPRFRATDDAEDLNWMNAQAFYRMKDYLSAGAYFKTYADQYGYGKYIEEAYFLAAMCDYHLSPRAELDQEYTRLAIEGFNLYLTRYPRSPHVDECRTLIKELQDKLVEKSYLSARLYHDMTEYRSAIVALTNSLKEYSDSKYREEMMYLKLNSLFLYAENSLANRQTERYQTTLDDYYSFVEEFPESRYSRDARRIYLATARALKLTPDTTKEDTDTSEANNQK